MSHDFRLRRELGDENGYVDFIERIMACGPIEILIWDHTRFEPCARFAGGDCDCGMPRIAELNRHWKGLSRWNDIEFLVPCDAGHDDCGFFACMLCAATTGFLESEQRDWDEEWIPGWDDVVLDVDCIRKEDLPGIVRDWMRVWAEPLAGLPIRMATYEESRRIWARYEEMHPEPEAEDLLRVVRQRAIQAETRIEQFMNQDDSDDND